MQGVLKVLYAALLAVLLAACSINDGDGGGDDPIAKCDTSQSDGEITVSGRVTYDRVPVQSDNVGLDYSATTELPVRNTHIVALCGNESLVSGITDANGEYSLAGIPNKSDFRIRVRAELADYDFTVVDNTSEDALYVLDSELQNSENDFTLDLNAGSGWTGSSYGDPRSAAPFAILDSVLVATEKIESVDPDVSFPPLQLNWSPNNLPVIGDPSSGKISTTYYQRTSAGSEIFILGAADSDTDEYDDHVIIHEWGHYLEDRLSRSDSIGGAHGAGDKLDLRVAYGEGFGNAWSGIATDDPVYFDTKFTNQQSGFFFNVETTEDVSSAGWYSETSVQRLLWDIYDSSNAAGDPDAAFDDRGLGLGPMYDTWVNEQRNTPAMTSIYSFAWALHADSAAAEQAWIEDLLQNTQNIQGTDIWGKNEKNSPDSTTTPEDDGLPVYLDGNIDSSSPNACSDREYGEENKSTNRQLYRIDTTGLLVAQDINILVNDNGSAQETDPDFRLFYQGGAVALSCGGGQECGQSAQEGSESARATLEPGRNYVLEVYDYLNVDGDDATGGRICFTVTLNSI